MDIERDSFIFYRSFYEAIKEIDNNEIKAMIFEAICEYSLNGKEIELSGISKGYFRLMKPQIEANNKRYLNGSKPKTKQTKSKTKAKTKQSKSKSKANVNDNVNENDNVNDNENEKKVKHTHGIYKHVRLTDDEYQRLQNDFPYHEILINKLDEYIETTGKSYKNHNLVLRGWVQKWYQENHTLSTEGYKHQIETQDNEMGQEEMESLLKELRDEVL